MNKLLIFILFLIVELIGLFIYFKYNNIIGKLITLFIYIVIIQGFPQYYIISNCFILLITIILYYYNYKAILFNINNEGFTNKLKDLKELNKSNLKQHFKNSSNKFSENLTKQRKEKSFDEYFNDFKSYKFTRKVKNSVDALNKMPFYIEKFKELWK